MNKNAVLNVSLLLAAAIILTACSATPTAAPTVAATTAPTSVPTEAPPPVQPTSAPTPVAQVPDGSLLLNGTLTVCSDIPYPPQEFYDENGNPQGVDIDLGQEISNRLGLQMQVVNSVFDTIIAAVTSGKCDIILSAMNITPDRNKQVSMIPYFQAGQSIVVAVGNPNNINSPMDLCGLAVAAQSGTTMSAYLQGTDSYQDNGLNQQCVTEGKESLTVVITQKDSDALQQLQTGKVAAYFTDSPVAGYYVTQHPDLFAVAGEIIDPIMEGIAVPCEEEDCTNAPLSPVGQAVEAALNSMVSDGTYQSILANWNLENSAVNP